MNGGDTLWRSAKNLMDCWISQISQKVKAKCLLAFSHFDISGFGISTISMTRSWSAFHWKPQSHETRRVLGAGCGPGGRSHFYISAFRGLGDQRTKNYLQLELRDREFQNPKNVNHGWVDFGISGPGYSRGQELRDVESRLTISRNLESIQRNSTPFQHFNILGFRR